MYITINETTCMYMVIYKMTNILQERVNYSNTKYLAHSWADKGPLIVPSLAGPDVPGEGTSGHYCVAMECH